MSAHTPGPWVVADDVVFQVRASDLRMLVADVRGWGHLTGSGGLGLSDEEAAAIQKANAHLIAAAPELLEAVRRLMGLHDVEADQTYCFDEKCGECDECFARAAIAKATGGGR